MQFTLQVLLYCWWYRWPQLPRRSSASVAGWASGSWWGGRLLNFEAQKACPRMLSINKLLPPVSNWGVQGRDEEEAPNCHLLSRISGFKGGTPPYNIQKFMSTDADQNFIIYFALRFLLLVQDNENPVNIMWKMQKRAFFNWYSNGQVDIALVKNEFQSISSWIESKSVWKSWKKSGMQLFANTKLVKNKYFTYIWPPKEVANWWKGQMPLCSRTQWIFESLADQNSEFLCWLFQFCAHLATSNKFFLHNRTW